MQETSLQEFRNNENIAESFNIDSSGTESVPLCRSQTQQLSWMQCLLFAIWIFIQCGACFGIESCINSLGIWYTYLGLILIPIFYSLPQTLYCSEMLSMVITNRSAIIWVHRAFGATPKYGDFIAFIFCLNYVTSTAMDLSIISILIYKYIQTLFALNTSQYEEYLIMLCFSVLAAIALVIMQFNVNILRNISVVIAVVVLSPFLIGFFYADINIDDLYVLKMKNESDYNYNWTLGVSMLIWLFSGWRVMFMFPLSMFCDGDISKKRLHLPLISAIILQSLVLSITIFTISAAKQTAIDTLKLPYIYDQLLNNLGLFVSIGAICCNIVKFFVLLYSHSQSLSIMSHQTLQDVDANQSELETIESNITFEEQNKIKMHILPSCFITYKYALLVALCMNGITILFPFEYLVEISVLLSCITFVFKCGSFLKLRYIAPSICRKYKVCGGIYVAWIIIISQCLILLLLVTIIIIQEPHIFIVAVAINVVFTIWYLVCRHLTSNIDRSDTDSVTSLIAKDEESKSWYASNTSRLKNIW